MDISTRQKWLPHFIDFLGHLSVETKDDGVIKLKEQLFPAQMMFLESICHGLDNDVHHFVFLKARQLGITTISLALDLFWLMVNDNTQGALICDTDGNRDRFRVILEKYIESLPKGARVPIKKHNRTVLVLENGSVLDYLVAGKRKNSDLGRGRALNFLHATEVSSYGDQDAISSLMATLSEKHPDRLYIFESTAKGFNLFWDMWESARSDEETQKATFIGWWAKDSYRVERGSEVYKKYWESNPEYTEEEASLIRECGQDISTEQLAWYRWKQSTRISGEGMMQQEYPWTAEQSFISTGRGFFPRKQVADNILHMEQEPVPYKGFWYKMTENMGDLELVPAESREQSQLKVWETPSRFGKYVIGFDPSYGGSPDCDNHAIVVFRCYADRLIQVAEFTTPVPETYQVTWVLAHLAATYSDCIINLEIFGPGKVVMQELAHQRQLIMAGVYKDVTNRPDLMDALSSAKWYMYNRPDSPGAGYAYNFSTTVDTKLMILNKMRDCYITGQIEVRSYPLLCEMQTMEQDGYSVAASGRNRDDRVMATALAVEAWTRWVRPSMIANGQTMKHETDRIASIGQQELSPFHERMITGFIANINATEESIRQKELWGEWLDS